MGVALSTLRWQMTNGHNTKGNQEEAAEALHIIEKLVRTMKDQWVQSSRNNPEFLDIPIVSTVRRFNWEECPNSLAHDKIAPTLERRISRFSHGYAAKGLHNLAQHAIGELLLHPRGLFSSRTYTVLNRDSVGGITRLDIFFFVYRFESKTLRSKASPLIACEVVKSTTKFDRINENTLRVLVDHCFRHSKPGLIKSIYQEFYNALFRGRKK